MQDTNDIKQRIYSILKKPDLACLATIDEKGLPWARYVIPHCAEDLTISCSTFMHARKVEQIKKNPEVHLAAGVPDMSHHTNYLQIQGKAKISTDKPDKEVFWGNPFWANILKEMFQGPEDPNFGVVIIKPYRIELWGQGFEPEVLEL